MFLLTMHQETNRGISDLNLSPPQICKYCGLNCGICYFNGSTFNARVLFSFHFHDENRVLKAASGCTKTVKIKKMH